MWVFRVDIVPYELSENGDAHRSGNSFRRRCQLATHGDLGFCLGQFHESRMILVTIPQEAHNPSANVSLGVM